MSGYDSDGYMLWHAAVHEKGAEVERLLKKGVKPDGWKNDVRRLCPPSAECAETPVTTPDCNTIEPPAWD
jgi:hypothetical protein